MLLGRQTRDRLPKPRFSQPAHIYKYPIGFHMAPRRALPIVRLCQTHQQTTRRTWASPPWASHMGTCAIGCSKSISDSCQLQPVLFCITSVVGPGRDARCHRSALVPKARSRCDYCVRWFAGLAKNLALPVPGTRNKHVVQQKQPRYTHDQTSEGNRNEALRMYNILKHYHLFITIITHTITLFQAGHFKHASVARFRQPFISGTPSS